MLLKPVIKFLTSLRLTVGLLCFAILIVFFGTLAQVDEGLYNAQHRWFHSFVIWWTPQGAHWRIPMLPGGYFVGVALLVNLLAAHIARFQLSWKKLGIHVTHGGLIVLLVGQLATDMFSSDTQISFNEGQTRNYSVSPSAVELVFISDAGNGKESVISIPQSRLLQHGEIRDERLPFTITVKESYPNADVLSRDDIMKAGDQLTRALSLVEAEYSSADNLVGMAEQSRQTPGRAEIWRDALKSVGESDVKDIVAAAKRVAAQPDKEAKLRVELKTRFQQGMMSRFRMQGGALGYVAMRTGRKEAITEDSLPKVATSGAGSQAVLMPLAEVKTTEERNLPAFVVELQSQQGSLGTWLGSPALAEQEFTLGDKTWRMAARFERHYLPFSMQLLKTTHDIYRGSDIPKNFQSRVRIENPAKRESREVDIYMNNPLRYEGLTFYQYQMGRDEINENLGNSVLEVVRNPSWLTPYFGCGLVAAGLLIQFGFHLIGFLKKRRKT